MNQLPETMFLLSAPFFVAGGFLVVSMIFANLSGWNSLAEIYTDKIGFDGDKTHFQTLRMSSKWRVPVHFSRVVILGADRRSLFLSVWQIFRFAQPSLLIPLEHIIGHERKSLIFHRVDITIRDNPSVSISLSRPQALWIEERSGGAWRYDRLKELPREIGNC